MKTFLKVLLLVVLALVALKLAPVALAVGVVLGAGLLGIVALGVSVAAAIACVLLGFAALLSPIWIPVLAIIGLVSLIKRSNRSGNGATA